MFRLDKKKIFLLYQYYLLGNKQVAESENEKERARVVWLEKCLEKEKLLQEKIAQKLKVDWEFSRLPPLERALLIYATYELIFGPKTNYSKMIIDQVINFSKAYCGETKYKYINKVLDLLIRDSKTGDE